jgi:lysozyme family protein
MEGTFDRALKFVLEHEGFKSDHPSDPGGRTVFGICARSYPQEVERMWTMQYDVARELAAEIYRRDYWSKAGCDGLSWPFDLIQFDTAVNMGVAKANALLAKSPAWKDYLLLRIASYASYKHFNTFGRGWVNRVIDLYKLIEAVKRGDA